MARNEGAAPRRPNHPAFLDAARAFYAEAFEHRRKRDLAASMAEWGELDAAEQRFTIAHLLYLNLHAQAAQIRALRQLRDLVGDVVDDLGAALADPEDEDGGEDAPLDGDVVDVATDGAAVTTPDAPDVAVPAAVEEA